MLAVRIVKHLMNFRIVALILVIILSTDARADLSELYGFAPISNNSGVSSWMAQQLSLEVVDLGQELGEPYKVEFIFKNNIAPYVVSSPDTKDGIIGTVFFEDGALFEIASINDDPFNPTYPVDFVTPDDPESKNFPEGGTLDPPFQTTAHFWSTNNQEIENGVNPGEQVGILFDLKDGKTFADVISAISLGFSSPDPGGNTSLRIGVHVQNLPGFNKAGQWTDTDGSDSFILTPVPGALLLGMLGMGVAGMKLRKFA